MLFPAPDRQPKYVLRLYTSFPSYMQYSIIYTKILYRYLMHFMIEFDIINNQNVLNDIPKCLNSLQNISQTLFGLFLKLPSLFDAISFH